MRPAIQMTSSIDPVVWLDQLEWCRTQGWREGYDFNTKGTTRWHFRLAQYEAWFVLRWSGS